MKRMPRGGYTIIEVMIFLVVSTALLGSVMAMTNGKQERTRFTQAVQTFDQDLRDIMNDVSTGFYPSSGNTGFTCNSVASGGGYSVTFGAGTVSQGANSGCVFLGKAIRLAPDTSDYQTYTMLGAREAKTIGQADVKLLGLSTPSGIIDRDKILADVQISKVISLTNNTHIVQGVALVSEFSQTAGINNTVTGNAARVTLYEIIDNFDTNAGTALMPVATNGVLVCLKQGVGSRKAAIYLGANGQHLTSELKLDSDVPIGGAAGCPA